MAILGSSKSGLQSFVYWVTFIVLTLFVTFFLNSMIDLNNAEQHKYEASGAVNSARMHNLIKNNRTANTVTEDPLSDGFND